VGGIAQPFDAFLTLRGLKTLAVRIDRQQDNTAEVVAFLQGHPAVGTILWPGLRTHPGYELHARQARGPGSLLAFHLNDGWDLKTLLDSLELIVSGASLGSVESLISSPRHGSHHSFSEEQLAAAGIAENLVRLSVGIESPADLIRDLEQAFVKARARRARRGQQARQTVLPLRPHQPPPLRKGLTMLFDIEKVFSRIPGILGYLPVTMELVLVSTALSLVFGFLIAVVRQRRIPIVHQICGFYVSFSRGTPAIVQLYLFFYGLPLIFTLINRQYDMSLPTVAPSLLTAIIAFTFGEAGYSSETIRASLGSVERGQMEAALSIGMSQRQAYSRIVIPEALVVALPPLGNALIGSIKNTSLAFTCAVVEMTAGAKLLASHDYRFFESYVSLAIIYWILILITSKLLEMAEKRLKRDERDAPTDAVEAAQAA